MSACVCVTCDQWLTNPCCCCCCCCRCRRRYCCCCFVMEDLRHITRLVDSRKCSLHGKMAQRCRVKVRARAEQSFGKLAELSSLSHLNQWQWWAETVNSILHLPVGSSYSFVTHKCCRYVKLSAYAASPPFACDRCGIIPSVLIQLPFENLLSRLFFSLFAGLSNIFVFSPFAGIIILPRAIMSAR